MTGARVMPGAAVIVHRRDPVRGRPGRSRPPRGPNRRATGAAGRASAARIRGADRRARSVRRQARPRRTGSASGCRARPTNDFPAGTGDAALEARGDRPPDPLQPDRTREAGPLARRAARRRRPRSGRPLETMLLPAPGRAPCPEGAVGRPLQPRRVAIRQERAGLRHRWRRTSRSACSTSAASSVADYPQDVGDGTSICDLVRPHRDAAADDLRGGCGTCTCAASTSRVELNLGNADGRDAPAHPRVELPLAGISYYLADRVEVARRRVRVSAVRRHDRDPAVDGKALAARQR